MIEQLQLYGVKKKKEIEYYETRRGLDFVFNEATHGQNTPEAMALYIDIVDYMEKGRKYDLERYKKSLGGRKSASLLTPDERIERARKAGKTRKKNRVQKKLRANFEISPNDIINERKQHAKCKTNFNR